MIAELIKRVERCSDREGYKAFRVDLDRVIIASSMCGLCQIRAETWLEKLSELSDWQLAGYIETYRAGWLDPFAGYNL